MQLTGVPKLNVHSTARNRGRRKALFRQHLEFTPSPCQRVMNYSTLRVLCFNEMIDCCLTISDDARRSNAYCRNDAPTNNETAIVLSDHVRLDKCTPIASSRSRLECDLEVFPRPNIKIRA